MKGGGRALSMDSPWTDGCGTIKSSLDVLVGPNVST